MNAPAPARPLANRVDPAGVLFATPARGTLMGNRGGRFHDPASGIVKGRSWATHAWICCRLDFPGRRRSVWGQGYTELFFCDEVTALSAGHRPCFECRRAEARAFAAAVAKGLALPAIPRAGAIDRLLSAERGAARDGLPEVELDDLPDGAVVRGADGYLALHGAALLRWTPAGYNSARARPRGIRIAPVTPATAIAALRSGYRPRWHPSAATALTALRLSPDRGGPS